MNNMSIAQLLFENIERNRPSFILNMYNAYMVPPNIRFHIDDSIV